MTNFGENQGNFFNSSEFTGNENASNDFNSGGSNVASQYAQPSSIADVAPDGGKYQDFYNDIDDDKKSKAPLIFSIAAVLLLVGISAGAYFLLFNNNEDDLSKGDDIALQNSDPTEGNAITPDENSLISGETPDESTTTTDVEEKEDAKNEKEEDEKDDEEKEEDEKEKDDKDSEEKKEAAKVEEKETNTPAKDVDNTDGSDGKNVTNVYNKSFGGKATFYVADTGSVSIAGNSKDNPVSVNGFSDALCNEIGPGATVIFLDGEYNTAAMTRQEVFIEGKTCSKSDPILIKSETTYGAIIDSAASACAGLTYSKDYDQQIGTSGGFEFLDSSGFVVEGFYVKGSGGACDGWEQGLDAYNSYNITFRGNKVTNVGGRALGANESSRIRIENNIVVNSALAHPGCTSAIDFFKMKNQGDSNDANGYSNYIVNNKVVNTDQPATCGANGIFNSDGNCIIIDRSINSKWSYSLATLIANNTCIDSDGGGVHMLESGNIDVINNTIYRSNRAPHEFSADININCNTSGEVKNIRVINNVTWSRGNKTALSATGKCASNSSIKFHNNVVVGGDNVRTANGLEIKSTRSADNLSCTGANLVGVSVADAKFVNPASGAGSDFSLQSGSVLINRGCETYTGKIPAYENVFDGNKGKSRVAGSVIDIGANEFLN